MFITSIYIQNTPCFTSIIMRVHFIWIYFLYFIFCSFLKQTKSKSLRTDSSPGYSSNDDAGSQIGSEDRQKGILLRDKRHEDQNVNSQSKVLNFTKQKRQQKSDFSSDSANKKPFEASFPRQTKETSNNSENKIPVKYDIKCPKSHQSHHAVKHSVASLLANGQLSSEDSQFLFPINSVKSYSRESDDPYAINRDISSCNSTIPFYNVDLDKIIQSTEIFNINDNFVTLESVIDFSTSKSCSKELNSQDFDTGLTEELYKELGPSSAYTVITGVDGGVTEGVKNLDETVNEKEDNHITGNNRNRLSQNSDGSITEGSSNVIPNVNIDSNPLYPELPNSKSSVNMLCVKESNLEDPGNFKNGDQSKHLSKEEQNMLRLTRLVNLRKSLDQGNSKGKIISVNNFYKPDNLIKEEVFEQEKSPNSKFTNNKVHEVRKRENFYLSDGNAKRKWSTSNVAKIKNVSKRNIVISKNPFIDQSFIQSGNKQSKNLNGLKHSRFSDISNKEYLNKISDSLNKDTFRNKRFEVGQVKSGNQPNKELQDFSEFNGLYIRSNNLIQAEPTWKEVKNIAQENANVLKRNPLEAYGGDDGGEELEAGYTPDESSNEEVEDMYDSNNQLVLSNQHEGSKTNVGGINNVHFNPCPNEDIPVDYYIPSQTDSKTNDGKVNESDLSETEKINEYQAKKLQDKIDSLKTIVKKEIENESKLIKLQHKNENEDNLISKSSWQNKNSFSENKELNGEIQESINNRQKRGIFDYPETRTAYLHDKILDDNKKANSEFTDDRIADRNSRQLQNQGDFFPYLYSFEYENQPQLDNSFRNVEVSVSTEGNFLFPGYEPPVFSRTKRQVSFKHSNLAAVHGGGIVGHAAVVKAKKAANSKFTGNKRRKTWSTKSKHEVPNQFKPHKRLSRQNPVKKIKNFFTLEDKEEGYYDSFGPWPQVGYEGDSFRHKRVKREKSADKKIKFVTKL